MLTANAFLFFMLLLLAAAMLEPLAGRLNIPFSIILVVLGFGSSEIVTKGFGIDIGINWDNFQTLITHVILPLLIYQAAIMADIKSLRENYLSVFMLALPLVIVSTVLIAAGVYYGIGHPQGFPWIAALLTGTILSSTDPATVVTLLKKHHAPKRLIDILEGESLFNETTAIVLFGLVMAVALTGHVQQATWLTAAKNFLSVFFGGMATGVMVGIPAYFIIRYYSTEYIHVLTTIISAYTAYILANDVFMLSGVMAVLATGLTIRILNKTFIPLQTSRFVDEFWSFTAGVAGTLIFLLAGVTITLTMFTEQWLAILIGIVVTLAARMLIIFSTFPVLNLVPGTPSMPFRQQAVLIWGGDRGTVTLALALSLPLSLDYWFTIQSIAYGVVLFTLFVQSTTMIPLIKKLNLHDQ